MKAREFFLMLLIIAAGVLLYHDETGEIENWRPQWTWDWDGPFIRTGKAFTFEEAGELPPPFSPELEVVNEHGSVEVLGGPEPGLSVSLSKRIWRRKEEDARRTADSLNLVVKDDGRKVIVTVSRPDIGLRNHETHLTLSVPEGMKVSVRNSSGRVKTARTGETNISNPRGAVEAADVRGSLTSDNSNRDVEVDGVAADCSIRSRHADVSAARVKGALRVEHGYGGVRLEDIGGDVSVRAPHSRVAGLRLSGTVNVESSYNDVSLTDAGAAHIQARNADVTLRRVRGDVDVSNSYGRTEVKDTTGKVTLVGRNMEVLGMGWTSPGIIVSTSYRDVRIARFSGPATITHKHGAVRLEPSSLSGELRVEAEYSPLDVLWPSGARAPLECRTLNGRINWGLAEAPSLNTSNGHSLLQAFPGESGGPAVSLKTTYADITIRPSAAEAPRGR
jgi:DUF4097 and DUF4098 domain-containing protein YvlB